MSTSRLADRLRWVVPLGFALSITALMLVLVPPPAYRFGALSLAVAFTGLKWGAMLAIVGMVLSLLGAILVRPGSGRHGFGFALVGLLLGAGAFAGPFSMQVKAGQVPMIHDISTDTDTPPAFVAALPLRQGAANPPDYAGPEVAAQQKAAYPDLAPLALPLAPADAVARATEAARSLGWEVIASEPAAGRVEAVATTAWWGFKDDVVVRVADNGQGGSLIDVRSKSRVGKSDLGANAARIRAFLAKMKG